MVGAGDDAAPIGAVGQSEHVRDLVDEGPRRAVQGERLPAGWVRLTEKRGILPREALHADALLERRHPEHEVPRRFGVKVLHRHRHEKGIETSYLRLRALPFTEDVRQFVATHDRVYVVEQNRDGQMGDLIRLEVGRDQDKIRKILHYTGLPCDARSITDGVLAMEADLGMTVFRALTAMTGATPIEPKPSED